MLSIYVTLSFAVFGFFSSATVRAIPVYPRGNKGSTNVAQKERVILGWKGVSSGDKLKVSDGGELGKVLYIADSTDLALSFARSGTHVCEVTAAADEWKLIPKAWVSTADIEGHKGKMQTLHPGAVLFASHTAAGIANEPNHDKEPWQMGIREDQMQRLKVEGRCEKKEGFKPGTKLHYDNLSKLWGIQGKPQRGA